MGIFPPNDFGPPPPQKVYEISNRIFGPPPSKSDKTPYRYMYIRNFHREVNPQKVCITQILYNFFIGKYCKKITIFEKITILVIFSLNSDFLRKITKSKKSLFCKNHYFSDFLIN